MYKPLWLRVQLPDGLDVTDRGARLKAVVYDDEEVGLELWRIVRLLATKEFTKKRPNDVVRQWRPAAEAFFNRLDFHWAAPDVRPGAHQVRLAGGVVGEKTRDEMMISVRCTLAMLLSRAVDGQRRSRERAAAVLAPLLRAICFCSRVEPRDVTAFWEARVHLCVGVAPLAWCVHARRIAVEPPGDGRAPELWLSDLMLQLANTLGCRTCSGVLRLLLDRLQVLAWEDLPTLGHDDDARMHAVRESHGTMKRRRYDEDYRRTLAEELPRKRLNSSAHHTGRLDGLASSTHGRWENRRCEAVQACAHRTFSGAFGSFILQEDGGRIGRPARAYMIYSFAAVDGERCKGCYLPPQECTSLKGF